MRSTLRAFGLLIIATGPAIALPPDSTRLPLRLAGWDGEERLEDIVHHRLEQLRQERAAREEAEAALEDARRRAAERARRAEAGFVSAVRSELRLAGMACYGESRVVVDAVPRGKGDGCARVRFRATCPGSEGWEARETLAVASDAEAACKGPSRRLADIPCDPAMLEVSVADVSPCEGESPLTPTL